MQNPPGSGAQSHSTSLLDTRDPLQEQQRSTANAGGSATPSLSNQAGENLLARLEREERRVMMKDIYMTKKMTLQTGVSGLQERVQGMSATSSPGVVQNSVSQLENLEARLLDLWEARLGYLSLVDAQAERSAEMASGRQYQAATREQLNALRSKLMGLEGQVSSNPARTSGAAPTRSYFDKLPLPTFSGKLTEYANFKAQFQSLTQLSQYPEVMLMEHLKRSIPSQHHHLIEGSSRISEAWKRLDEKYADKITASIMVQESLVNLDLKGKEFEKIERLQDEIQRALRLLDSMGARKLLTDDLRIIGRLVSKLPENLQLAWSRHAAEEPGVTDKGASWTRFVGWLDKERQAALIRRQYHLLGGGGVKEGEASQRSKLYCSRCKSHGHEVSGCKLPGTMSQIHHANDDPAEPVSQVCAVSGSDQDKAYAEQEARAGKCPMCGEGHLYQKPLQKGGSETVPWPSSQAMLAARVVLQGERW